MAKGFSHNESANTIVSDEEWNCDYEPFVARARSEEDVLAEIGLYLVVVLGIVIAINFALGALHVL